MRLKLAFWVQRIINWFDFGQCYKESLGYNCKHRVYPSGFKECGEFPNYWKGDK